uniref:Uncharacterized protein n=1 Tax=Anguilla anguilla TaxID=7936 RepID=A0A0E9TB71_ANGAN
MSVFRKTQKNMSPLFLLSGSELVKMATVFVGLSVLNRETKMQ